MKISKNVLIGVGSIALGLYLAKRAIDNGKRVPILSSVIKPKEDFQNAGANWVACPNPAYDCEGDCTANYGANAWDANMGGTGSCNTGGAYWNPSPPSQRKRR